MNHFDTDDEVIIYEKIVNIIYTCNVKKLMLHSIKMKHIVVLNRTSYKIQNGFSMSRTSLCPDMQGQVSI